MPKQHPPFIAKKLSASRLEEFLTNHEKMLKRKAAAATKVPDRMPFDCSKPVARSTPKP
jgi:hypothetical protein